ncbi:MAG: FHA domain-containing protein [Clostridiaceae bacterium]
MDLSILSLIFKIIIIVIIYVIIFTALRIMYKDMKGGVKSRRSGIRNYGLEILNPGNSSGLRKGSVIPVKGLVTIGRKADNILVLDDPYASSYHAKVYIKNGDCIIEDMDSTNGTILNGEKLIGKEYLVSGDEINIGNVSLRFI